MSSAWRYLRRRAPLKPCMPLRANSTPCPGSSCRRSLSRPFPFPCTPSVYNYEEIIYGSISGPALKVLRRGGGGPAVLRERAALAYDPLAPLPGVSRGLSWSASDVALTRLAELYPEPATEPRGINLRVPPSAEHLRPTLNEGCDRSYPLPNCGRRPLAPRPLQPLTSGRRCSVDLGSAAPLNSNPEGSQVLIALPDREQRRRAQYQQRLHRFLCSVSLVGEWVSHVSPSTHTSPHSRCVECPPQRLKRSKRRRPIRDPSTRNLAWHPNDNGPILRNRGNRSLRKSLCAVSCCPRFFLGADRNDCWHWETAVREGER